MCLLWSDEKRILCVLGMHLTHVCDIVYKGKLEILTFLNMNNNCGTKKNILDKEQ